MRKIPHHSLVAARRVPPPGTEALVLLDDRHQRVTVLGRVRVDNITHPTGGYRFGHRIVRVLVEGEERPRDVAVERFL